MDKNGIYKFLDEALRKKLNSLLIREFVGGHRVNFSPYLTLSHARHRLLGFSRKSHGIGIRNLTRNVRK
jgi:hypothetical protein